MRLTAFAKYAWALLAYNVAVVLWGATVRASGSGAGCGQHWPLCDGVVIPGLQQIQQVIEFSHRASSGLVVALVALLIAWAWRAYPKGHPVRQGAAFAGIFTVTEALLGASLVLFGWVGEDASMGRVAGVGLHLINTFLLLASLTLTALWASGGERLQVRGRGWPAWVLGLGLLAALVLGMSGAITALADTLFPSASLAQGMQQDFSPTAHFLTRLRVVHPLIAVTVTVYLLAVANLLANARPARRGRQLTKALTAVLVTQLLAGALNVALLTPIWMQLVHLFLADMVWITLVLLSAAFLAREELKPVTEAPAWLTYAGGPRLP